MKDGHEVLAHYACTFENSNFALSLSVLPSKDGQVNKVWLYTTNMADKARSPFLQLFSFFSLNLNNISKHCACGEYYNYAVADVYSDFSFSAVNGYI